MQWCKTHHLWPETWKRKCTFHKELEPFCLQILVEESDNILNKLEEYMNSTPILVIDDTTSNWGRNITKPILDSQSTVLYDEDTIILSSTSSSQVSKDGRNTSVSQMDQLRCCMALLRVIYWSAEKDSPPQMKNISKLHNILQEMVKQYDI